MAWLRQWLLLNGIPIKSRVRTAREAFSDSAGFTLPSGSFNAKPRTAGRRRWRRALAFAVAISSIPLSLELQGSVKVAADGPAPASWTVDASPSPGSGGNDLGSVTCPAAGDCWAIGSSYNFNSNSQTLIEHQTQSGWVVVSSPEVPNSDNELGAVTCVGSTDCWAVGDIIDSSGTYRTLIEHYDGSAWTIVSSPNASSNDNGLGSVTCVGPSDCWAAGSFTDTSEKTLLEHFDGTSWTIMAGPGEALRSITCVAANRCWAINVTSTNPLLLESFDGSVWSAVPVPTPGTQAGLSDIMCISSGDCWTVGSYYDAQSNEKTLTEHYNGNGWSIISSASPGRFYNSLGAIACVNGSDCWASGGSGYGATGDFETLVEHYDGNGWTAVSSPNPGTAANGAGDVACTGTGDCVAVGSYCNGESPVCNGDNQVSDTLIESYDPSSGTLRPGAPLSVQAVPIETTPQGETEIHVAWAPPASAGDSRVTSYTVEFVENGQVITTSQPLGPSTTEWDGEVPATCSAQVSANVYATNVFGNGGTGSSPPLTPVQVPAIPNTVVVLAEGIDSSLPDTEAYDPARQSYCSLEGSASRDLRKLGLDFNDPAGLPPAPTPTLTDALAERGAVVLPFSYRGAQFQGATPGTFTVNTYQASDTGDNTGVYASMLDQEIRTAHSVWPNASIAVVGHSLAGLVATDWFEHQYTASAYPEVTGIYALDSPVNGVADRGGLCLTGVCDFVGGFFDASDRLLQEFMHRWSIRDSIDQTDETKDQGLQAILSPIVTPGDQLYSLADVPDPGVLSQYLCSHSQATGHPCVQESGDYVTAESSNPPCCLTNVGPSHDFVKEQPSVISYVSQSIGYGGPCTLWNCAGLAGPKSAPGTRRAAPDTTGAPSELAAQLSQPAAATGQTISVTGAGFGTGAGQVTFSSTTPGQSIVATVASWTDTSISVTVPTGAGPGPVEGATAVGVPFYAGALTLLGAPDGVNQVAIQPPNTPPIAGQQVTVRVMATGSAGDPVPNVPVSISDGLGSVTAMSDAAGVAHLPVTEYAPTALVAVSGSAWTSANVAWTPPPVEALTLTPSSSQAVNGSSISVVAALSDANGVPIANQPVTFYSSGATPASLSSSEAVTNSSGIASVSASASSPGVAQITASTNQDATTSTIALSWSSSVVSQITPATGPIAGGVPLFIMGAGFTSSIQVYFGSTPAASTLFLSSSLVLATSSAGQGSVDVRIEDGGVFSPITSADVYTYGPPTVTELAPNSGPSGGGTVVLITGTNFAVGAQVVFGGVPSSSVRVLTSTSLVAVAPACPAPAGAAVPVTVITGGGSSVASQSTEFAYTG